MRYAALVIHKRFVISIEEIRVKMTITDWTGFIGVTILLVAFFLNLRDVIQKDSLIYILLNIIGAALACLSSILLKYVPFIILEAVWTIVSIYELLKYLKTK